MKIAWTLPVLVLLACDGVSKRPTGYACDGTQTSAMSCAGDVCIQLSANQQNKKGICSKPCTGDECGDRGVCLLVPNVGSYCFRTCTSSDGCVDGFICIDSGTAGTKVCFAQASAGQVTCPASLQCTEYADAQTVNGYCTGVTGAVKVCDCPGGSPSTNCTLTGTGAANVYCCP